MDIRLDISRRPTSFNSFIAISWFVSIMLLVYRLVVCLFFFCFVGVVVLCFLFLSLTSLTA